MAQALHTPPLKLVPHSRSATPTELSQELSRELLRRRHLELELSNHLQIELDIQSIIGRFSKIVQDTIEHTGVQLSTTDSNVVAISGQHGKYQQQVELILHGEAFAVVTLMSRQSLPLWAAASFRYLASYLVHPVKNALLIQSLHQQTLTDPLTGSLNRNALKRDLEHEVARARRYHAPLTVVMLDIDHFKRVNDSYGHSSGDQVLIKVAEQIRGQIRQTDSLYRFGGEEFTLLLRDTTLENATRKVESILRNCSRQRHSEIDSRLQVTLSAGLTTWSGEAQDDASSILERADEGLYCSKEYGRNQATIAAV